jgi:type III pantothenate kinase
VIKSDMQNILEIDIGNSLCKWRVRQLQASEAYSSRGNVLLRGSQSTQELLAAASCADFSAAEIAAVYKQMFKCIAECHFEKVVVCSVAANRLNQHLSNVVEKIWAIEPWFFVASAQCEGVINSYRDPSKMGADRWLASIAAKHLYEDRTVCVADCGTAINVEFVSDKGVHEGGYIIPGVKLMQQSLLANTEHVRCMLGEEKIEKGKDTQSTVLNGSLFTVVALLEKLQREVAQKNGLIIITGGSSDLFIDRVKGENVIFNRDLVLDGFRFLT